MPPTYGELTHLRQNTLHLCIKLSSSVVVADVIGEISLNTAQFLVALLGELGLHADHSLEAGVKVGYAEIKELG